MNTYIHTKKKQTFTIIKQQTDFLCCGRFTKLFSRFWNKQKDARNSKQTNRHFDENIILFNKYKLH